MLAAGTQHGARGGADNGTRWSRSLSPEEDNLGTRGDAIGGIEMDQKNLDIYGSKPIPWSRALKELEAASTKPSGEADVHKTYWLATTRPDGRPHIAGVGALWVDGRFYFTSGPGTRKSRNLAANPSCALSSELPAPDLVVEGRRAKVPEPATVDRLPHRYAAQGSRTC